MFLKQTLAGVEMTRDGRIVDRVVPEFVRRAMDEGRRTCAHCRQDIRAGVSMICRGGSIYHRSCADSADATPQPVQAPIIAYLSGTAFTFAERCTILEADGTSHMEMYERGAFEIDHRQIPLRVNHGPSVIPCSLAFSQTPDRLGFIGTIRDSDQARYLRSRSTDTRGRSVVRGVSIETNWLETEPDRKVPGGVVVKRARLTGLSITVGDRRPAWFGTHIDLTWVS